jgi:outer membrane protein
MKYGQKLAGWLLWTCLVWPAGACMAAELTLIDALRLALSHNPAIRVQQQQLELTRAQEQQARGQFDWILSSSANHSREITPSPPSALTGESRVTASNYRLGLNKQLRTGLSMSGDINAGVSQNDAILGQAQQNRIKLEVALTLPLQKGGAGAVAATEDAARLNVLRSRYELRNQVARIMYDTMLAWWDFRTRVALREVAQNSVQRAHNLLESNQKLVNAGEKPRADLVLLQADRADKVAAHQAAQLAVDEARKTLGRLLGLDLPVMQTLAEPADALPGVLSANLAKALPALNAVALKQRPDWQALSWQIEAQRRQLQARRDQLKAQLDLSLGVGLGRASEGGARLGFVTEPGRNQSAPSLFARLNYQVPLENNQATGAYRESAASLAQLEIRQRDLQVAIEAGVDSAVQTLERTANQLNLAHQALAWYELAVSQEMIKQKNGIATLIDVINIENRFVSSRSAYLQLQLAYANALARLRFETGSLMPVSNPPGERDERFELDLPHLTGLGPLVEWVK